MLNRRSLFALVAGSIAALTARAQATQQGSLRVPVFNVPRGVFLSSNSIGDMVSTGYSLVRVDSLEGQEVLNSMAVNLRPDGSIRHRQHHPTDFPPKR